MQEDMFNLNPIIKTFVVGEFVPEKVWVYEDPSSIHSFYHFVFYKLGGEGDVTIVDPSGEVEWVLSRANNLNRIVSMGNCLRPVPFILAVLLDSIEGKVEKDCKQINRDHLFRIKLRVLIDRHLSPFRRRSSPHG